jgi:hypothetical protein
LARADELVKAGNAAEAAREAAWDTGVPGERRGPARFLFGFRHRIAIRRRYPRSHLVIHNRSTNMSRPNASSISLAMASFALALSIYAAFRRGEASEPAASSAASATGSGACVDAEARAQLAGLRRALNERDAQLARGASASDGAAAHPAAPSGPSEPAEAAMPTPRRYTHFETANPAVSVSVKDDGTYDIRNTDPSLAGSIVQVTAVTETGHEDKMFVRIPQ